MTPARVAEIVTPKGISLDGLWLGPIRPKRTILFLHGLGGTLWRRMNLAKAMVDKDTAVLIFNNRGHDRVSRIVRAGESRSKKNTWGGGAFEVFEECVDDIQGAVNFVRKQKGGAIFLAGHSTGSQKSVYYATRSGKAKYIRGVILMVPLSDYSTAIGNKNLAKVTKLARSLVRRGKPHELLPQSLWPMLDDAQRFISLYTPDSTEEMFLYAQPKKIPRLFRSLKLPTLAIFAGDDEFGDRPAKEIAAWFEKNTRSRTYKSIVIPKVRHGLKGGEVRVAAAVKAFMKEAGR